MELRLETPVKFQHPCYEVLTWFAANNLLKEIKGMNRVCVTLSVYNACLHALGSLRPPIVWLGLSVIIGIATYHGKVYSGPCFYMCMKHTLFDLTRTITVHAVWCISCVLVSVCVYASV